VLVVLGSLLVGGVLGEILGIEGRLERLGGWLRERTVRSSADAAAGDRTELRGHGSSRASSSRA